MLTCSGLSAWHDESRDCQFLARSPAVTLRAFTREELATLPGRTEAALGPELPLAAGLLSYHAGEVLMGLAHGAPDNAPLAVVHLYREASVQRGLPPASGQCRGDTGPAFVAEQSRLQYRKRLARIREYLHQGDCYQVNYARRFTARTREGPLDGWLRLLGRHPAPHASYFQVDERRAVFGVSPERFLRIRRGVVVTEPIKGSRPRGSDPQEDEALGRALVESEKDRSENLMIVDLLRNDLGKVCRPGSVRVKELFGLRRVSNVQHLVSCIAGRLREDVSPLTALLHCFPGGSVTGAPKKRAMEIIRELEPHPRGYYCGSQFRLDAHGNLDSNILIRTFQQDGDMLVCHGGGGIVADSDTEQEFAETGFKVGALMRTLAGA